MRSVLVVLAVAGCYRSPAPPAAAPANKVLVQPGAAADDVLAFLPIDADFVVGVDAIRLRDSALYRRFEPQAAARVDDELEDLRACGLDPLRTVERAAIAGKINDGFQGVVVVRGLDGARTLECLTKVGAREGKVVREGDFVSIKLDDDSHLVATFVATSTVVVQVGPGVTVASLREVLASGAPLRGSAAFMKLFAQREQGAAMWGMVNGTASFVAELRGLGVNPRAIDGTVTVTDRLTAAVRMTFHSTADADKLAQMAAAQAQGARAMFERLDVRAKGEVVHFDMTATEAQLRTLIGMLGGF